MNAYKGFRCNTVLGGAPFSAAFTRPIDGFQLRGPSAAEAGDKSGLIAGLERLLHPKALNYPSFRFRGPGVLTVLQSVIWSGS